MCYCVFFFFFQAEDGIRDYKVTGVQTCALPISRRRASASGFLATERAEPALESADGGAEGRGYRHLEEEVVGVAGPLEGDEVLVRDLVGVKGHLVDVAGEVGRDVLKIGRASCRERV